MIVIAPPSSSAKRASSTRTVSPTTSRKKAVAAGMLRTIRSIWLQFRTDASTERLCAASQLRARIYRRPWRGNRGDPPGRRFWATRRIAPTLALLGDPPGRPYLGAGNAATPVVDFGRPGGSPLPCHLQPVTLSPPLSLHLRQHDAEGDALTGRDVNLRHATGARRADFVLHFHRFQHHQRLPELDGFTRADEHARD